MNEETLGRSQGQRSAKLSSHKQALTRSVFHCIIIALAVFVPGWVPLRIFLGIIAFFSYGAIASSKRFQVRLETELGPLRQFILAHPIC